MLKTIARNKCINYLKQRSRYLKNRLCPHPIELMDELNVKSKILDDFPRGADDVIANIEFLEPALQDVIRLKYFELQALGRTDPGESSLFEVAQHPPPGKSSRTVDRGEMIPLVHRNDTLVEALPIVMFFRSSSQLTEVERHIFDCCCDPVHWI